MSRESYRELDEQPGVVISVIALLVNVFVFPGVGTWIGGRAMEGFWQFLLTIVGVLVVVGMMMFKVESNTVLAIGVVVSVLGATIGWIWGACSGIDMIRNAERSRRDCLR